MKRSRLPISVRILIVIVGAFLLLVGFALRDFEEVKGGGGHLLAVAAEDGTVTLYESYEGADTYGIEPIGSEWGVFTYSDDGETRTEVFRGSEEDAHAFYDAETMYVAFVGTEAEAQAWERARQDEERDFLPMNVTIAAGALIILAGLGLGWRRRPERPADADASPQDLVGVGH